MTKWDIEWKEITDIKYESMKYALYLKCDNGVTLVVCLKNNLFEYIETAFFCTDDTIYIEEMPEEYKIWLNYRELNQDTYQTFKNYQPQWILTNPEGEFKIIFKDKLELIEGQISEEEWNFIETRFIMNQLMGE